ncbi:MAG: BON domain-containing protein [Pigmentiphaga sp.]
MAATFFARAAVILAMAASATACVPVLVGSAVVGTTAVATDRRTAGMQLEDQSIELRIRNLLASEYGDDVRVTPSSYNGKVLLLGNAPDEATRERVGRIAGQVENVSGVVNQIEVGPPRPLSEAANDSLISGQVRAALIGTADLSSNAFVITTHRNTVYLQGRVTAAEGATAARVASGLRGVNRVVTLYEPISEEEASRFVSEPPPADAPGTGGQFVMSTPSGEAAPPNSGALPPDSGALAIPVPKVQ